MLEDEVFKKRKLDNDKLIPYGFIKEDDIYKYSKLIMDDTFRVDITIDSKGNVIGRVYDLDGDYEYTNFRLENVKGDFVNRVKDEYFKVIESIANNCYTKEYFIYKQSNELSNLIKEKYNVIPEFLWESNPNYGIFRNKSSNKWFGVIMNIDRSKLNPNESGEVEVLNVKLDDLVNTYLKEEGIYPAYHMSKKSWVSITLDNTLSNKEIMSLIEISFDLSNRKKEWIIPANPKYYDIVNAFNDMDTITWRKSHNFMINDIVYIYITEPYAYIMFKCVVISLDEEIIKLKLIKKYNDNEFTFERLKNCGVKSVRSPRGITSKLSEELNNG